MNYDDIVGSGVCTCSAEHLYSGVIDPTGKIYRCLNDLGNEKYAISSVLDEEISNPIAIAKYDGRDPFTEKECETCKIHTSSKILSEKKFAIYNNLLISKKGGQSNEKNCKRDYYIKRSCGSERKSNETCKSVM